MLVASLYNLSRHAAAAIILYGMAIDLLVIRHQGYALGYFGMRCRWVQRRRKNIVSVTCPAVINYQRYTQNHMLASHFYILVGVLISPPCSAVNIQTEQQTARRKLAPRKHIATFPCWLPSFAPQQPPDCVICAHGFARWRARGWPRCLRFPIQSAGGCWRRCAHIPTHVCAQLWVGARPRTCTHTFGRL